jgi:TonB family protein
MNIVRLKQIFAALAIGGVLTASSVGAQTVAAPESGRKIKTRVAPVYPELARRMSVSGKVKLEIVVTPDGRVKSTRVIGGHPILVQACQDAVKDWKFVPGPEETTQVVEFDFQQ